MRMLWAVAAAAGLLLAAGCATRRDRITVGSKDSTEQLILGEILAQHLEARLGLDVERNLRLGATNTVHQALIGNQIDVYPEYTGAALTGILKLPIPPDPTAVYEQVRDAYAQRWNLEWLSPLGFDNRTVLVVRKADSGGIRTLSDAEQKQWRLGIDRDFELRPDGLTALNTVYDISWKGPAMNMEPLALYRALEQKHVDMIAGKSTDSGLASEIFTTLTDDRNAFPPYQASVVARRDACEKYPRLKATLEELSGKISNESLRRMVHQLDVKRAAARDVASAFLRSSGLAQARVPVYASR